MFYDVDGTMLEPYSKAPLEVLHHRGIKDFSKLLYFELYSIFDQNKHKFDHLFIKDETLAQKLNVSEVHVKKSMKDLEDNKLIKRETSAFDRSRQAKKRKIYLKQLKRNRDGNISYTRFPKSINEREDLNSLAKIVLIELTSLLEVDDFEGESYGQIHVGMLADSLGKHRRTALNNINHLAELGYIVVEGSGSERMIQLEKDKVFNGGMYI